MPAGRPIARDLCAALKKGVHGSTLNTPRPATHWYDPTTISWCAFCNQEIEHVGFDPCEVTLESARSDEGGAGGWLFWAHALCGRDRFDQGFGFAHDIPRDDYIPGP